MMPLWKLAFVVAFLGGFIYGYNAESMSGAILFIERQLNLSPNYAENLISARLWGALITISLSAWLANRFGRKPILLTSTFLLILGPGIDFALKTYINIDIGRWITGFGLGINTVVFYLYLSEMAPEKQRSKLLTLYGASIAIGNLSSDIVNAIYSNLGNWHLMLGLIVFPALLQFVFLFSIPESNVWINRATNSTNAISQSLKNYFSNKQIRMTLVLAIVFAALTEAIGMDTLFGYTPTIFEKAGFTDSTMALWATTGTNAIQLIAALLIIVFIEKSSRKLLLISGLTAMTVILLLMAITFWFIPIQSGRPWIMLVFMFSLSASYNFAFTSVAWVVISEMFSNEIRPLGLVMTNLIAYLLAVILSQYYLNLANWIGFGGTFFTFAILCIISIFFISRYLKETKDLNSQPQQLKKTS